jgi:hypothetical protein
MAKPASKGNFFEEKLKLKPAGILVLGLILGVILTRLAAPYLAPEPDTWLGFAYTDKTFSSPAVLLSSREANFDWADRSPSPLIPADNFAMKWVTCLKLDTPRKIYFSLRYDDNARLFVDEKLILDNWDDKGKVEMDAAVDLTAGLHSVRVDYYEIGGGAVLQVEVRTEGPASSFLDPKFRRFPGWINDPTRACAFVK